MKKVLIVYTSIGGNTELVCEEIQNELEVQKIPVKLQKCQLTSEQDLLSADFVIFACPTYAHGELQAYFSKFLSIIEDMNFSGKKCAVVGLGDPKYDDDYNIESAVILTDWFKSHNAELAIDPLEINRCPIPQLKTTVKSWAEELITKLS